MAKHRAELPHETTMREWNERMQARNKARFAPFVKEYCQGFEDGMDGFVIHAVACPRYQDSALSGTGCINYTGNCYWPVGLNKVL